MVYDLTFWIAVWGAVLSTILLIFQAFQFSKDRPKLIVEILPNTGLIEGRGGTTFYVKVTNRGRRPISIHEMGINKGDETKKAVFNSDKVLKESKSISASVFVLQSNPAKNYILQGWAKDSNEKIHFSKNKLEAKV